jgi:xanthine dehydrogenase YagS FAD-binding subunit
MERFSWQTARSVPEAAALTTRTVAEAMLADDSQSAEAVLLKAGGIDLLDLMKERLLRPARLVNLRAVPALGAVEAGAEGVRIGALVTLEQIAAHPLLRQRYAAVADAAGSSASPEIRHVATLGGNLLQRPRCWYFRSAAHRCARKGGDACFAFAGENQYHAVFAQYGCAIVHPSTIATALVAFGARVTLTQADGTARTLALSEFLIGPNQDITRENLLRAGEVLTAVLLPPVPESTGSVFIKQAEKPSFDWSIADVAVVLDRADGGACRQAAIVLGAAAPTPWRAAQAEAALVGQVIDAALARQAGQAAIAGAAPLRLNGYKLPVFTALVRRAVLQAAGLPDPEAAP